MAPEQFGKNFVHWPTASSDGAVLDRIIPLAVAEHSTGEAITAKTASQFASKDATQL